MVNIFVVPEMAESKVQASDISHQCLPNKLAVWSNHIVDKYSLPKKFKPLIQYVVQVARQDRGQVQALISATSVSDQACCGVLH